MVYVVLISTCRFIHFLCKGKPLNLNNKAVFPDAKSRDHHRYDSHIHCFKGTDHRSQGEIFLTGPGLMLPTLIELSLSLANHLSPTTQPASVVAMYSYLAALMPRASAAFSLPSSKDTALMPFVSLSCFVGIVCAVIIYYNNFKMIGRILLCQQGFKQGPML